MPDVVLSNDDLTVLAGPSTVELLVDIGPTGTRGSKFFVGIGNPNSLSGLGQILNDMYIDTAPGPNYGYLYQYISAPGGSCNGASATLVYFSPVSGLIPYGTSAGLAGSAGCVGCAA